MSLSTTSRLLPLALLIAGAGCDSAKNTEPAAPVAAAVVPADTAAPAASVVDPAAADALNRMNAYLGSLHSFAVSSQSATDLVLGTGQKVQVDSTIDLAVEKPNKLFIQSYGPAHLREITYDGETLSLYSEPTRFYTSAPAGKSVTELLDIAARDYGIELPLADLITWSGAQQNKLESAVRVAPLDVNGKTCQLYAFRQPDADWQACITEGKEALPLKIVITSRSDPAQPQTVHYLDWRTNPVFSADTFQFVPPKGATRIEFAPPSATKK